MHFDLVNIKHILFRHNEGNASHNNKERFVHYIGRKVDLEAKKHESLLLQEMSFGKF